MLSVAISPRSTLSLSNNNKYKKIRLSFAKDGFFGANQTI